MNRRFSGIRAIYEGARARIPAAFGFMLILALTLPIRFAGAQEVKEDVTDKTAGVSETLYIIKLRDGSQIIGALRHETADEITVGASFGETKIVRSNIKEMTRVEAKDVHKGEYWSPDPNQTRSLVFPTASTLPAKKLLFENYYLIFNSLHFGATDKVMFSLGIAPLPGAAIFTFGPKAKVYHNPSKTVEVAVGGHLFAVSDGSQSEAVVLPYGVVSFGNAGRGRFNVGGGGIDLHGESAYFVNMSGDVRVARGVKLMGEMFIFSADRRTRALPMYGARFFSEKLSCDVGFWNIPEEQDFTPLGTPMVSLTVRF
jgi:hypothetical protein